MNYFRATGSKRASVLLSVIVLVASLLGVTSAMAVEGDPPLTLSQEDCPAGAFFVDSVGMPTVSSSSLATGVDYRVTVSGVYDANATILADAKFSADAAMRTAGDPWTDEVHKYEAWGSSLLNMLVDDTEVDWGAFSAAHEYSLVFTGSGVPLDFRIYDLGNGVNNTGGLCVLIEEIPEDVVTGGGQVTKNDRKSDDYVKISFGGGLSEFNDGSLTCHWTVRFHDVGVDDLDGTTFQGYACSQLSTWAPGGGVTGDGVVRFTVEGTLDGAATWALFRIEDAGEPGGSDTIRIELYDHKPPGGGSISHFYDSYDDIGGESNNVGGARALLDNGNFQIYL